MKSKLIFCIAVICTALVLAGAALLFICTDAGFDADLGYFNADNVYVYVLYAVLAAGVVAGIVLWIAERKQVPVNRALPGSAVVSVMAVLCGIGMIASSVPGFAAKFGTAPEEYDVISYVSYGLSVLAAVSLFITAARGRKEATAPVCVMAFFPALFFASKVLVEYFDRDVAVNSPVKILTQIVFISFMLMFTAEAGLILGRGQIYSRYLFVLSASAVLGGAAGLGALILAGVGIGYPVFEEMSLLMFVTALYAAGRLYACAYTEAETKTAETPPEENKENTETETTAEE